MDFIHHGFQLASVIVLNCFPEHPETPQQGTVLFSLSWALCIGVVRRLGQSTCFSLLNLLSWIDLAYRGSYDFRLHF